MRRVWRACLLFAGALILLSACSVEEKPQLAIPKQATPGKPTPVPVVEPEPARVLSVCMGREPDSLFLYGNSSSAAEIIRQAIYDGPIDTVNFQHIPVILERIPSRENQDVQVEGVEVYPGQTMVDPAGNITYLKEGVRYRPAGCYAEDCEEIYAGEGPAALDRVTIRYQLKSNLKWSDGEHLTSEDSLFSYHVAQQIWGEFGPPKVRFGDTYRALDERTLEWVGIPGYLGLPSYADFFFSPLPAHRWGATDPLQLAREDQARRFPLGWGPYVVEEWASGDHLTLSKNEYYFRLPEGLPYYDQVVFRFLDGVEEALNAFQAGECVVVVEVPGLVRELPTLQKAEIEGDLHLIQLYGGAWEQLVFGVQSLNPERTIFRDKKVRQAVAQCINRQEIVGALPEAPLVAEGYYPHEHPSFNENVPSYSYNPSGAVALLEEVGWVDHDQNPDTPLQAQGVEGVEDGTPFAFQLLISPTEKSRTIAEMIKMDLAKCSLEVEIQSLPSEELLGSGPESPVFGRDFNAAQFAWTPGEFQLCSLFLSSEIPGYYPVYPKGWGGANAPGYENPDYDTACQDSFTLLPDLEKTQDARDEAQMIFAEDLPVLPLYFRRDVMLSEGDIQGLETGFFTPLWNIESLP
ncbi:MAG: ABC transporter substrate-binding protein [Chloroflexota bacterium]